MTFPVGRGYPVKMCAVALMLLMVFSALSVLAAPTEGAGVSDAATFPWIGEVPEYMRFIRVNDLKFDPLAETPSIPEALSYDAGKLIGSSYFIVQFKGPVTQAMKRELTSSGFTLLHYLNYNAFIVRSDVKAAAFASDISSVRWCGVFEPAYKLSPRLSEDYDAILQASLDANLAGPLKSDVRAAMYEAKSRSVSRTPGISGESVEDYSAVFDSTQITSKLVDTSKKIDVIVSTFEKGNVEATAKAVYALGGTDLKFTFKGSGHVVAEVDRSILVQLARIPGVMWVDRMTEPYVFNDIARWVVQSADGVSYSTPIHDHGLNGSGQVVTVCDTGIDYDHDAFEDPSNSTPGPTHRKVTAYYIPSDAGGDGTDNGINHGTHVSGTVAGDDGTWYVFDGNPTGSNGSAGPHDGHAFNALLQVQDVSTDGYYVYSPTYLPDDYQCAMDRGSWIHTNSWGSSGGAYITEAAQTDDFLWNNMEFIVLYSAGNAGGSFNSISPYASAKNVIAVGATENGQDMEDLAYFSSRGPTDDGRIKPDVCAPGVDTWSARGNDPGTETDDYMTLSGTSMSTPCVAGSVALIRDYFMSGFYPTGVENAVNAFTPSAALVKAVLINGATEMNGLDAYDNGESWYPNNNQGWGRILLDDGLFFEGDARGLVVEDYSAGVDTGNSIEFSLAIGDASEPVEITLVWTDYPGSPLTSPNLVNDLDLTVVAPDGTYYLGNNYVGYNPGESEPNPDTAYRDRTNNVEGVLVLSGVMPGLWKVTVSGFNVPYGPQPFALSMTGGIATEYGLVSMDGDLYKSEDTVVVSVVDTGLNTDPLSVDTCTVDMISTTEMTPETITLSETGNDTSIFIGMIATNNSAVPVSDGQLQVLNGDMIASSYFDADNGLGGSEWKYDFAAVDDDPPLISAVAVGDIRFNRATISWTTDEDSDSRVMYGVATPPGEFKYKSEMVTSHVIALTGLLENTTYYFAVASADGADNQAVDDNGSAYHTFTTPPRPPPPPADDEWPTFHNNVARTGYSSGSMYPPLELAWHTSQARGGSSWTGPVVKNGILYMCTEDGYIRAMDAFAGNEIWARQLGDYYTLQCVPVVEDGAVYATFYGQYGNTSLYALDALTGETIWVDEGSDFGFDFIEWMVLAYSDGLLYGGTTSDIIWAIDASNGSLVWTYGVSDWLYSGATVNGGQLYMACYGGTVLALDQYSGALLWSAALDGPVSSPPLVAQGALYIGTFAGSLYCIDELTGAMLWHENGLGYMDYATPAYDGEYIYFGSEYGAYCLDASTGTQVWAQTAVDMTSAVVYSNDYVYCVCLDGYLRVLDAFDGSILDQDYLSYFTQAQPAASEGWVWAADAEGRVYAFTALVDVGLILSPTLQRRDVVPGSTVDYCLSVKNIGVSGPDVFDAEVTLGALGWAVELYHSDAVTPLSDTDGDLVIDTGPIDTGNSTNVIVRVTVPAGAAAGDEETSVMTFTSSNDPAKHRNASVICTVPPPGVEIWPNKFVRTEPGVVVSHTFNITNTGAIEDVFDIAANATLSWAYALFASDGVTPLADSDLDGTVDTGAVGGLMTTSIVLTVTVPADAPLGSIDKLTVFATSSLDTNQAALAALRVSVPEPVSTVWPTFQHDLARSGISPEPFDLPLSYKWTFESTGGGAVYTAPIVVNDKVYFGTYDGYFKAVDAYLGELVWDQLIGEWGYYLGIPSYYDGMVYITYGESGTYDYTIGALDAETGSILWTQHTDGFCSRSTVVAADGAVYTADSYGNVYAFDAYDGTPLWVYWCGYQILQGPSLIDGLIVAASYGGGELFALDLDGNLVWNLMLGSMTCAPSGGMGMVFVGDMSGRLYCVDSQSGTLLWTLGGYGSFIFSTPAFQDGMLYITDYYGTVACVDAANGSEIWRESPAYAFLNSPIVNNGTVFAGSTDGYLHALDAATGEILDSMEVTNDYLASSMALAGGYLYVVDEGGYLYAYAFDGAGVPSTITVEPSPVSVTVGGTKVLGASCIDRYGHPVAYAEYEWSVESGEGSIIVTTESGQQALFMAPLVAGTTVVNVSSGSAWQNALVNVVPGSANEMMVTPGEVEIAVDEAHSFSAIIWDAFGNEIPSAAPDWSCTIGTISSSGEFSAGTVAGQGTVTATWGSLSASSEVTVLPGSVDRLSASPATASVVVGGAITISVTAYDLYDNVVSPSACAWASTVGSILPFGDGSQALFFAGVYAGTGLVSVSLGSESASVAVTVVAGNAAALVVSPAMLTLDTGDSVEVSAQLVDSFGNAVAGVPEWDLQSDSGAALGELTVGSDGLSATFVAGDAGASGLIVVSVGVLSASVSVEISEGESGFVKAAPTLAAAALVVGVVALALVALLLLRRRAP